MHPFIYSLTEFIKAILVSATVLDGRNPGWFIYPTIFTRHVC